MLTKGIPLSKVIHLGMLTGDDVVANEVGYNNPGSSPVGYYLNPFGVTARIHM